MGFLLNLILILFRTLKRKRPRDTVLNCGVSIDGTIGKQTLYLMSSNVLNTFSKEEAVRIESTTQYHIADSVEVDVIPINNILDLHLSDIPFYVY